MYRIKEKIGMLCGDLEMPTLTIITATYNRVECLKSCYESLKRQLCKDFQWLIIDDGSTDNTKEVVDYFVAESPDMCIDYVYKENGGKHTALNASHEYIKGKYVVMLDSDDRFTCDAVKSLIDTWKKYEDNKNVGQVIFLKGYSVKKPICYVRHENTPLNTLREPRIGVTGRDCCDSYRTSLFVKYRFPEFEGEKFIGEGAAFLFIEMESLGVYINKVIYLCAYRADGLTNAGRKMRLMNPKGGRYNSKLYMDSRIPFKTRMRKGILYVCYSRLSKVGAVKTIRENEYKLLTLLCYIPGLVLYFFWKHKYEV